MLKYFPLAVCDFLTQRRGEDTEHTKFLITFSILLWLRHPA